MPQASLTSFFNPRSIAVVGASKTEGKIGHSVVKNAIDSGFKGGIYPINPKETEIMGLTCFPSVSAIPGPVDLVAMVIPAPAILPVAEECGRKGVKHLVTITAGFKEVGKEGLERERKLLDICHRYGMRMLGPNCLGMMDTHTPLNVSFAPGLALRGGIAFVSQSGALQAAILDWSFRNGLGFSRFVSLGNKADLSEVDFIADAAADPNTKVILVYIEGVTDGRRFLRVAREASRRKPVIILKSGTSQAGAQAASSHTGALAGSDLAYDTAFKQAGVLRARTMEELFGLAVAFTNQPTPKGDHVTIVTNSGGPGIIASDAVEANGLSMARFRKETVDALRAGLPPECALYNPVDLIGSADGARYKFALDLVADDPATENLLVLLTPPDQAEPMKTAEAVVDVHRRHPDTTVFASFMGGERVAAAVDFMFKNGVSVYDFPEPAIQSIKGMVLYGKMRQLAAVGRPERLEDVDKKLVANIFEKVRDDHRRVLLGSEAARVARAYGIPSAPAVLARDPEEAAQAADSFGYPVVLKVASPKILHKTDVGGVKVGLKTPEEVQKAFVEILDNIHRFLPGHVIHGVEVYKMMPQGTELIIGLSRDLQFGHLLMFGLGGIYVNLLKDVSFRLVEGLTRNEIETMISETKAYTLLRGFRGAKPADLGAVVDAVARVAQLARDFPEVTDIDINPLFAYEKGEQPGGITALDVKITIS
ncbi:MAG: acetate--CoA ligase alpha subunit [Bacillota bacterium]